MRSQCVTPIISLIAFRHDLVVQNSQATAFFNAAGEPMQLKKINPYVILCILCILAVEFRIPPVKKMQANRYATEMPNAYDTRPYLQQ